MFFKKWRRQRVLRRYPLDDALWQQAVLALPVFRGMSDAEDARLRALAVLFMYEKTFEPAAGMVLDDAMCLRIAALAALPVLGLNIDWYDNFQSVIVYPDVFISEHDERDEIGVVHSRREYRSGEAWEQGGVLVAWPDVADSGWRDGWNVLVHELAHKLDMQGGGPDGMPPLHADMRPGEWQSAFSHAYDDMAARLQRGEEPPIDPYCLENTAECFAVFSEYFFELPQVLNAEYPKVYQQLRLFYRQDPLSRLVLERGDAQP